MPVHEFIVEDLKTRVDKFLVKQLPAVSRAQIQRDVEGGQVEVNGQVITESKFVVRKNDKVVYNYNDNDNNNLKPSNIPLKVLYNNHGLIIIDKPAGLTVHPGAGFKGDSLASALLYHFKDIHLVGEEHRPGIVHRLDKDTSGVILVATTQDMYEYLKNAFQERRIKKEYIALVAGRIEKSHGVINTPIGRSKTDFRKYTTKNMVEPKDSLTEYQVLEHLKIPESLKLSPSLDECTLIRVKLHTGRTHQIRVHLSSVGHPLIGDDLYGGKKAQMAGLNRQFLHAKKIEVQLPDRTWIEAESELPNDLRRILENLGSKYLNSL